MGNSWALGLCYTLAEPRFKPRCKVKASTSAAASAMVVGWVNGSLWAQIHLMPSPNAGPPKVHSKTNLTGRLRNLTISLYRLIWAILSFLSMTEPYIAALASKMPVLQKQWQT